MRRGGTQHQRDRRPPSDQVGVHTHLQHPQATLPVVFPQRLVPLRVPVTAEDVIDRHIQAPLLTLDCGNHLGDRIRVLVINDAGGARSACGADQLAGFLDGLGPAEFRRTGGPAAAAGRVDEEPSPGQLDGDRPARTPSGTRHQGDAHAAGLITHQISKP